MSSVSLVQVPARTVVTASGGTVEATVKDDLTFVKGTHKSYIISPDKCPSGPITGASPIIFRLHRDTFGTIDKVFLTLDVENPATNLAALPLVGAPWLVDRIDVMLNGVIGKCWQSITGKDIYESLILLPREEREALMWQDALHLDPESFLPNGYEIPIGVTRHFRIPLLTSIISRLNLQTIKEDVIVHVHLAANPVYAGAENGSLGGAHLEFRSFMDPLADRALLARAVGSVERYIPFCYPVHQQETVTLTDGSPRLININLIGDFAGLSIAIVTNTSFVAQAGSLYIPMTGVPGVEGWEYAAKIDLLGPDRQSILGSGEISAAEARYENNSSHFPSGGRFATAQAFYLLPFSMDMAKSIRYGERHGERSLDGNHYLSLTCTSDSVGTWATGEYTVLITGYRYAGMSLKDGVFSQMK